MKVVCLLAAHTKYPFCAVNTVSENNVVISQKLVLNTNLIISLSITDETLPSKAVTGISMVIGL